MSLTTQQGVEPTNCCIGVIFEQSSIAREGERNAAVPGPLGDFADVAAGGDQDGDEAVAERLKCIALRRAQPSFTARRQTSRENVLRNTGPPCGAVNTSASPSLPTCSPRWSSICRITLRATGIDRFERRVFGSLPRVILPPISTAVDAHNDAGSIGVDIRTGEARSLTPPGALRMRPPVSALGIDSERPRRVARPLSETGSAGWLGAFGRERALDCRIRGEFPTISNRRLEAVAQRKYCFPGNGGGEVGVEHLCNPRTHIWRS